MKPIRLSPMQFPHTVVHAEQFSCPSLLTVSLFSRAQLDFFALLCRRSLLRLVYFRLLLSAVYPKLERFSKMRNNRSQRLQINILQERERRYIVFADKIVVS